MIEQLARPQVRLERLAILVHRYRTIFQQESRPPSLLLRLTSLLLLGALLLLALAFALPVRLLLVLVLVLIRVILVVVLSIAVTTAYPPPLLLLLLQVTTTTTCHKFTLALGQWALREMRIQQEIIVQGISGSDGYHFAWFFGLGSERSV